MNGWSATWEQVYFYKYDLPLSVYDHQYVNATKGSVRGGGIFDTPAGPQHEIKFIFYELCYILMKICAIIFLKIRKINKIKINIMHLSIFS